MAASQKLSHLLQLADQGPTLRAALAEEVAELLTNWPADYPQSMRGACEALLAKAAHDVDAATRARLLGCDGKWALHPDQIAVVNEVFSPSEHELARAQAVMDALQAAGQDGHGVLALEGEMIDEATRKSAEDLLARGRAAGLLG